MNGVETRAELVDPGLKESSWNGKTNPEVKVHLEYHITLGKIKTNGGRNKPLIADCVLSYKDHKLSSRGKSNELAVG